MTGTEQPSLTLGNLQILVGALMAGVVALLAVAIALSPPAWSSIALTETQTVWLGVVAAMVVGAVVIVVVLSRLLIARVVVNAGREGRGEREVLADYASFTVVRSAVVEGVGLLGATVYLAADLGVGLLVTLASLAGLVILFPTAARHQAFVERVTRPE